MAVAWGIGADVCEIYSDVDGVYTADPRVCPRAKKLDAVSYDDMLELSGSGAGVLQMRAVGVRRKCDVVIHSRSAFSDAEGTYIKEETDMMEEAVITGIAHDTSEVKVTIRGVPDMTGRGCEGVQRAGRQQRERGHDHPEHLGSRHHRHQLHVRRRRPGACARDNRAHSARHQRPRLRRGRGHREGEPRGHGHEVVSRRGGARVLYAGENQINILAISTSPIRLSVVVDGSQAAEAVRCLHKAFDLDSDSVFEETQLSAEEIAAKMNKGR